MAEPLRLPYSAVTDSRGQSALRPLLRLVLSDNDQRAEGLGLLDTGADVNVLPYRLGLELGLNWDEESPITPPSGNLSQYDARGVILDGAVGDFPSVRLVFAWTRAEGVPLILGQVNFFLVFDVCFYRSRRLFEIQPVGE